MKKLFHSLILLTLCALLPVLFAGCGGEETFRNARVISVSGSAELLREGTSMDVYSELVLKGGDRISTAGDGRVDLKLDEDKYVVLEPNTTVTLELEGDPQKGAIRLHQVSGTIHHTIENPLSEGDSYEVHTPDAVMAVRGTDFSTTVSSSEEGTQTTTQVQEGTVEMTPNDSEDPSRLLGPGESAAAGTDSGEPSHFLSYCPLCRQEADTPDAHLLSCGEAHYSCDGSRHELLACGHPACAEGDHETLLDCGAHPACAQGDHKSKLDCGHFVCADGDHAPLLDCGSHHACAQGDHKSKLPCGHYVCAEGEHGRTFACGHYICRGGAHDRLSCGHFACDGRDHNGTYGCGHQICQGGNHQTLGCSHFACDGGSHETLGCGHYSCSQADLEHETLSCGNYACLGGEHSRCYGCGECVCTGDHSDLGCGHPACQGGSHDPLACGHFACAGGNHDLIAACGHYTCDGKVHDGYHPCGYLLCAPGHGQLGCGHCPTCHSGQDHTTLPCGSYACQDGHSLCAFCGGCVCTGTHGDGLCNVTG